MTGKSPFSRCSDEELLETVRVFEEKDRSVTETAKHLGKARSTIRGRLKTAHRKGLCGEMAFAQMPVPYGFGLKRVSSYVTEDGLKGQWIVSSPETDQYEQALDAIDDALERHTGKAEPLPKPTTPTLTDLLTVYALADHHLGMRAWAKEAGRDYDTEIAWKLLHDTMVDLVTFSPPSEEGLVLNLGDFFHADSDDWRTANSGNVLDGDGRWSRVLSQGVDLTLLCVQLALQKHNTVTYRALAGNHDNKASLMLAIGVKNFFHNEPRVHVDADPGHDFVRHFGNVMIGAAHGDRQKPDDMPGRFAARYPDIWGATRYRYCYLGHVHHRSRGGGEKHGMVWETFQALTAKDAWHAAGGYTSGRSMTAITHHREQGERFRVMRSIDWR